jgi:hypothetical protein
VKAKVTDYDPATGECSVYLGYKTYELEGAPQIVRDYIEYKGRPLPSTCFDPWSGYRDRLIQDMIDSVKAALVKQTLTGDNEQFRKDIQEIYDVATTPIAFA